MSTAEPRFKSLPVCHTTDPSPGMPVSIATQKTARMLPDCRSRRQSPGSVSAENDAGSRTLQICRVRIFCMSERPIQPHRPPIVLSLRPPLNAPKLRHQLGRHNLRIRPARPAHPVELDHVQPPMTSGNFPRPLPLDGFRFCTIGFTLCHRPVGRLRRRPPNLSE